MSEAVASNSKPSERSVQWLALALTPGLGPTKARRVIEFFGSVQALFRASLTELEAAGLRAVSAQSLGTGRSMEMAQDELGKAAAADARIVALEDPGYPTQLKQIYDPPLILYVRGNETAISQPGIALVGTRHPTPYGSGMAERLACDLAARGVVIFSGMARGIDTAGHRGAIAAKGKTVAVWGTGVDVVIPRRTRDWWSRFSSGWCRDLGISDRNLPRTAKLPFAIASSAASRWEFWWWKPLNTAVPASPRAARWSRTARFSPYRATSLTKARGRRIP